VASLVTRIRYRGNCPVTVHESMVTSVHNRMEPRRSLLGASVDQTDARSVTDFGLDDGAVRLRADRSVRSCEAYPSVTSGRNQPATRRARVCSASSTGDTPKSRLSSRLNCDALSYPDARAAVPAL